MTEKAPSLISPSIKIFVYQIDMKCMNCVKTVSDALNKHKGKGILEYHLVPKDGKIEVTTENLTELQVTNILKTTGKDVSFISMKSSTT